MDAAVKGVGRLRIDIAAVQNEAAEGRLDVAARAAETVVEIEVAESRVEVVAPQQADDAPAEPDALGIARRSAQNAQRLGVLVDFLRFLGGLLTGRRALVRGFASLFWASAEGSENSQAAISNPAATLRERWDMADER